MLVHAFGLLLIRERIVLKLEHAAGSRRFRVLFAIVVCATVVLLTALHAIEGAAWVFAYVKLGALPDARTAMLFERYDQLRPRNSISCAPLADDGRAGSAQRHDAVRPDDRFPVLRRPGRLAKG